jgi:hypothetical protein
VTIHTANGWQTVNWARIGAGSITRTPTSVSLAVPQIWPARATAFQTQKINSSRFKTCSVMTMLENVTGEQERRRYVRLEHDVDDKSPASKDRARVRRAQPVCWVPIP